MIAPLAGPTASGGLLVFPRLQRRASPAAARELYRHSASHAYGGYDALYAPGRKAGPIYEAACWAHARRPFYKAARTDGSALARGIVTRMDAIFALEREFWGKVSAERLACRQEHVAPLVADLERHLLAQYARLSPKGGLAKAINYMLPRWASFARFVDDGRICMTDNAAERRVRTIAVGRRNWTFCGSDRGGERAAAVYTLIQTCRLNDVDPHAWLAYVIATISDHPQTRLRELLPWNWKACQAQLHTDAQAA